MDACALEVAQITLTHTQFVAMMVVSALLGGAGVIGAYFAILFGAFVTRKMRGVRWSGR